MPPMAASITNIESSFPNGVVFTVAAPGFIPVADVSVVVVVSAVSEPWVLLSLHDQMPAANRQAASARFFFLINFFRKGQKLYASHAVLKSFY